MTPAGLPRMGLNTSGVVCGFCPPLGPAGAGKGHFGSGSGPFGYPGYGAGSSRESASGLGQLVGLCCVATVGTLGHIYTISACIVGDRLRKKGNMFLANLSLVMLPVTLLVLPSMAIHKLAKADISEQMQRLHDHLVELCGCVSLFMLCMVAVESYVRLCHRRVHGRLLTSRCVIAGLLLAWTLGGATFASALLARSGPHAETHALLLAGIVAGVSLITASLYLMTWRRARHLQRCTCHGHRTRPLPWHVQVARANAAVWLSFCASWLPAAALQTPGGRHDWLQWLPLVHACSFSVLYALFSEDFRESYSNLAQYCCCKISVHFGRRPRSDLPRPMRCETRKSSMRVHLVPGYDMRTLSVSERPARGLLWATPARSVISLAGSRSVML